MPQQSITHDKAKEIIARLNERMKESGGSCVEKGAHGESDGIYRIDFEVAVGENLPLFQQLQGASLLFGDADLDHLASHFVLMCAKRDGLAAQHPGGRNS